MELTKLLNEFIIHLKKTSRSNSTVLAYTKDIKQFASTNINKKISAFTEEDIKHAMDFFKNSLSLTPKTISRKLNAIRTFYKFLVEKEIIKTNPANKINHPKFKLKKPRVLSRGEYLALKEICRENMRLFTMVEVLLQTGIRISELSRLKVKHVRLNGNLGFLFIEEFSSNFERTVPLNIKAAKVLKDYLTRTSPKESSPLFATRRGKSIEIRNIRSSIDRAISKTKIKNVCVNDLRNTFIYYQLMNGMSIERLAEIVGHRNINTTSRYLQLLPKKYTPGGVDNVYEL